MKATDSVELHSNFKSDTDKILMYTEKIKRISSEVKLGSDELTRFKNLFKY